MIRQSAASLLSLGALLLWSGCGSFAPIPEITVTTTPAATTPVVEPPPARVRGSEEKSTMLDNFTAYIVSIDGAKVGVGREGWQKPITLKPGPRKLGVVFVRGAFTAKADLPLAAISAGDYVVKFASDAQFFGQSTYCEFWIADGVTGKPIGERVRVPLTRVSAN